MKYHLKVEIDGDNLEQVRKARAKAIELLTDPRLDFKKTTGYSQSPSCHGIKGHADLNIGVTIHNNKKS